MYASALLRVLDYILDDFRAIPHPFGDDGIGGMVICDGARPGRASCTGSSRHAVDPRAWWRAFLNDDEYRQRHWLKATPAIRP
ncbi:MAG: hypothetical protein U1F20_04670 [Lysobacterales bacterium]